jgi:hypothetical protein
MAKSTITHAQSRRNNRPSAPAAATRRLRAVAWLGLLSGAAALSLPGCASDGQNVQSVGAAGSSAGSHAAGGTGGSTTASASTQGDPGQGDGKDVITIGDSYMSLFVNGIQQSLEKISMRDYRNYAFPGTLVLNEQIPNQYKMAVTEDPNIKTVVMTGGGNDVLNSTCTGTCQEVVDKVSARLDMLFADMATNGVQDIVLISYGYPADVARHESLDYSRSLLPKECSKDHMPRCHFIDPIKELDGKISSDGIHPTAEGFDILGQMVWDLMQAEHMRR